MQNPQNYGWDIPAEQPDSGGGGNSQSRELTIEDIFKRMWIPVGGSRTIVWVPDKAGQVIPYKIYEYQITDHSKQGAAKWNNFERVPEDPRNDWINNVLKPASGDIVKKYFCGYASVMVMDTYTDKKGKERGPFLNAVCLKLNYKGKGPLAQAKRHHDKYGNLAWRKYTWTRDTQKDASSCGNDWMFEEVCSPEHLPRPENLKENQPIQCINWNEYHRVKSNDELAAKYGHLIQNNKTYSAPPANNQQNYQQNNRQQNTRPQGQGSYYNQNQSQPPQNYNQQPSQQPQTQTTDRGYPHQNNQQPPQAPPGTSLEQVDY